MTPHDKFKFTFETVSPALTLQGSHLYHLLLQATPRATLQLCHSWSSQHHCPRVLKVLPITSRPPLCSSSQAGQVILKGDALEVMPCPLLSSPSPCETWCPSSFLGITQVSIVVQLAPHYNSPFTNANDVCNLQWSFPMGSHFYQVNRVENQSVWHDC